MFAGNRAPTKSGSSSTSARTTELFSPPYNSPSRTGSISSAVFNLTTTMVGGGVLSLPYAFDQAGIIVAFVFLLLIGICADFTVYSLVSCSRRSGEASFEGVAKYALGPVGYRGTSPPTSMGE